VGANRFEARAPLANDGVTLGTVRVGAVGGNEPRVLELPPVTLPYSPEFERSPDPDHGRRLLARLTEESGGLLDPAAGLLWRGERAARSRRPIVSELLLAALLLLVLEIAGRRLQLWSGLRLPRTFGRLAARARRALARPERRSASRVRERVGPAPSGTPPASPAPDVHPSGAPASAQASPAASTAPPAEAGESLADALARARRKASRRTRR